jgi:Bacterial Ig-like domain (group 3)
VILPGNALAPGAAAPSGSVTFRLGKKTLGKGTLSDGIAIIKTKKLALGSSKITVVYGGNANFEASTSATLKEVVKKKPPAKKSKKR